MKREKFGPRSERSQRLLDQLELQLEELAAATGEDTAKAETTVVQVQGFTRRQAARRNFPAASAAPADRPPGADRVPVLRRQQALQDRRGHHRNARRHSAAMVRDRACAGEVQLPRLRDDQPAAGAVPCDRPRLCRSEPAGDDAGREVRQPSAAQPAERAVRARGDRAVGLDHGRSCRRLRGHAAAAPRADQGARVRCRARPRRRHHRAGAGEGKDPHRADLDLCAR